MNAPPAGIPIRHFLIDNQLQNKDTFIETFQDVCKIKLKFMEQRVRATSADMDLAGILKVDFGFPLFFVQNVYYSEKEIPVVVTHMYYRSDHYVYTVKKNLQ